MPAPSTVTLILVFILVAAIAAYLIAISYTLYKVSFCLGTVLIGVRAIAQQCEPIGEVVGGIADDLSGINQALEGLVASAGELPPNRRVVGR